jgi:nucleotide-binding universal stress UspA family protein
VSNHIGGYRPPQSTVLAGIDGGTNSLAVLRASASYAELFRATILIVHVTPTPVIVTPETAFLHHYYSPGETEARLLPLVIEALYDRHVSWKLLAVTGSPAKALAELAERYAARAIVVGAHGGNVRSRVRLLATSVTHRLTQLQRAPVIVVPATHASDAPSWPRHEDDITDNQLRLCLASRGGNDGCEPAACRARRKQGLRSLSRRGRHRGSGPHPPRR